MNTRNHHVVRIGSLRACRPKVFLLGLPTRATFLFWEIEPVNSSIWFRIDAVYYLDDAILEAGEEAEVLFVRSLGLSKLMMSDGFLTRRQLLTLGLENLDLRIESLVEHNLWTAEEGGWQIRSWLKWNQPASHVDEIREKRRAAGRKGGRPKHDATSAEKQSAKQSAKQSDKPIDRDIDRDIDISTPVCSSTTSPRARVEPANGNSVTHNTATDSIPEQQAPVDGPHPDPVRPNDVNRLWYDELGLTSAPSYDRLQGGMRLTALNVHYSHGQVEQAVRKVANTPALRSWVGRRGPAYLAENHKGQLVIDTVGQWQSYDRGDDMSDEDLRKMMDAKRQRISKMIGA